MLHYYLVFLVCVCFQAKVVTKSKKSQGRDQIKKELNPSLEALLWSIVSEWVYNLHKCLPFQPFFKRDYGLLKSGSFSTIYCLFLGTNLHLVWLVITRTSFLQKIGALFCTHKTVKTSMSLPSPKLCKIPIIHNVIDNNWNLAAMKNLSLPDCWHIVINR